MADISHHKFEIHVFYNMTESLSRMDQVRLLKQSDRFDILLVNPNKEGAFTPGQKLEAVVRITLTNPLLVKGITITIKGISKTEWKEKFGPNEVIRGTTEEYFKHNQKLTPPRIEKKLDFYPPGDHEFPVHFFLPGNIPSSFEGKNGIVKYYIAGSVQLKNDKTQMIYAKDFRVIYPINLSLDITNSLHMMREETHNVYMMCCGAGRIKMSFSVDKRGYTPGEPIILDGEIINYSGKTISYSKAALVQKIIYIKDSVHKLKVKETIAKVKHNSTEPDDTDHWDGVQLPIPPDTPPNLERCNIINVSYAVKIEVVVARAIPSRYKLANLPIKMGTIPVRLRKTAVAPLPRQYLASTGVFPRVHRSPIPAMKFSNVANFGGS